MLQNKLYWIYPWDLLDHELRQGTDEGRCMDGFSPRIQQVKAMTDGREKTNAANLLLEEMSAAPMRGDYPYEEPVSYEEIAASLSYHQREYDCPADYGDRVRGAWYGRAIGCLLGIPVENWMRKKIADYLQASGQYPLQDYIHSNITEDLRKEFGVKDVDNNTQYDRQKICWINNVKSFPVDDDTNYTVAALKTVERFGKDFTTQDAAETWVYSVGAFNCCTAERVAYRNLLCGVMPPDCATLHNPYREWIGAQIRADLFGYISPGRPTDAARMAYRDASVSHVKNGAYGEMLVAAILSLCATEERSMSRIVETALEQIPPKSRLYAEIKTILTLHAQGQSFELLSEAVHQRYNEADEYDWCHTIPNAMLVVAAILSYSEDFSKAICQVVSAGFDTDCNGATVGSILGMFGGFQSMEPRWYNSLEPTLQTSLSGYFSFTLEELAARTEALAHPIII